MRSLSRLTIPFAALILFSSGAAIAEDAPSFLPSKGSEVVIYSHHFKAENFEEGLKLVEDGFTAAQLKMGQTRRNYFLVNPSTYDVVVVSFFGENESVNEWHKFMGRLDVLEKLAPMRREPLELERYTLDAITTTP